VLERQGLYHLSHTPSPLCIGGGLFFLKKTVPYLMCIFFFFFFAVLGLELRDYTLSHSTSPFLVMGFFEVGFQP
jgi:hypothetical protein